MVIHEKFHDLSGAGKYDLNTTRYISVQGGSRSRLPIQDDPEIRRYHGFVGIDEWLTESVFQIAVLFHLLGGKPVVLPGQEGSFAALILGESLQRLAGMGEAAAAAEEA